MSKLLKMGVALALALTLALCLFGSGAFAQDLTPTNALSKAGQAAPATQLQQRTTQSEQKTLYTRPVNYQYKSYWSPRYRCFRVHRYRWYRYRGRIYRTGYWACRR